MSKVILIVVVAFTSQVVMAQRELTFAIQNINGSQNNQLSSIDYLTGYERTPEIKGTAYFDDTWTDGIVKLNDGTLYKDISLKYNILEDVPYYQGADGLIMKFIQGVREFSLLPEGKRAQVYRKGFPEIAGNDENSFYEVLSEGKAVLLKKTNKWVVDNREYNSAVTTYEVISNTKYYLVNNGKIEEVEKNESFFLAALSSKKAEIETFITDNKVDLKNENHLARLISFYNTLK